MQYGEKPPSGVYCSVRQVRRVAFMCGSGFTSLPTCEPITGMDVTLIPRSVAATTKPQLSAVSMVTITTLEVTPLSLTKEFEFTNSSQDIANMASQSEIGVKRRHPLFSRFVICAGVKVRLGNVNSPTRWWAGVSTSVLGLA